MGADLARSGAHYEAVVLDRFAAQTAPLSAWLSAARQVLASPGRLWLFERHESLGASSAGALPAQPLARLRQLLDEAGFACERLSPIQAGREQALAAVAVPAWAVRTASVA